MNHSMMSTCIRFAVPFFCHIAMALDAAVQSPVANEHGGIIIAPAIILTNFAMARYTVADPPPGATDCGGIASVPAAAVTNFAMARYTVVNPRGSASVPAVAVTNFASAVQAVDMVHALWPNHAREYAKTVASIAYELYEQDADPAALNAAQRLFDEVAALQTFYHDIPDGDWLLNKRKALWSLIEPPDGISRNPSNWLAFAKIIAQLKSEINPDLWYRYINPPDGLNFRLSDEERRMMLAEHRRRLAMGNYQVQLANTIMSLVSRLEWANQAEFDDDAKRHEYRNELIKAAKLTAKELKEIDGLDVSKNVNAMPPLPGSPKYTPPPAQKPAAKLTAKPDAQRR